MIGQRFLPILLCFAVSEAAAEVPVYFPWGSGSSAMDE